VIQLASWHQRKLGCLDRFHLRRKNGEKAANQLHGVIYIYEKLPNLTFQKHSDSSAMGGTKDLLRDIACCERSGQAETYSIVMVRYLVALWDETTGGYEPSNPGWPTL